MNKPKDWRSFFLPEKAYADEESLRLHRFFISTCFVTAIFATCYFFMSIYMHGMPFAEAMAVSVVIFIAMPFFLRTGVSLKLLANGFVGVICIIGILLIYWEGGIRRANTAPWIMVLPSFAIMLQGTRVAKYWLTISLIIICVFSYYTFNNINFPVLFDLDKDPVFSLLSIAGLVCIVTFIFFLSENERKKAHDDLTSQNKTLDKLSKEKTKFLQIAAHDLRNPLIVIQGLADRSADQNISEEERAECLEFIISSADRMSELIKNLLEIQVIDAGKMAVSPKEFSLNTLINLYTAQTAHMASIKQAEIVVNMPAHDIVLFSDPARVEQILDNYVSNAIKYSKEGSKVYIDVTSNDKEVEIRVKDEGPGISEEEQKKLFQQFSTTSSVPRSGEHATGLGLAIVKKIADALEAEIGCESKPGNGSTFYICFPKSAPSA